MNQRAFNFFRLSRLNSYLWKTKSNVLKVPFERPIFDCLFVCCWIKTKEFDLAKIFKGRGFSNFIRTLSVFLFWKQNLIEYENILFFFFGFWRCWNMKERRSVTFNVNYHKIQFQCDSYFFPEEQDRCFK